jgi:hypothetical protein
MKIHDQKEFEKPKEKGMLLDSFYKAIIRKL